MEIEGWCTELKIGGLTFLTADVDAEIDGLMF